MDMERTQDNMERLARAMVEKYDQKELLDTAAAYVIMQFQSETYSQRWFDELWSTYLV